MEKRQVSHPSAEDLRAYSLGKLDERAALAVWSHLAICAECRNIANRQSSDTFLSLLRSAGAAGSTPVPRDFLPADVTASQFNTPIPDLHAKTPQELAGHAGFAIVREIGRGGMGIAYLARDTLMEREVVLKVLSAGYLGRPEVRARFIREIRAAA